MAQPQENQGAAPAGRVSRTTGKAPLSRSDAARHASLVRWGKEQPFAARLQAIRDKRKTAKGGGKKKPTKPDPKAKAAQNVANVGAALNAQDAALSKAGLDTLAAAALGTEPSKANADALIAMGMAERGADGRFRLSSDGKAVLRAAEKGDTNAVLDRLSVVSDKQKKAAEKEAGEEAATPKLDKDGKPIEEKKPAGGGGGGGKKEPDKAEKLSAQQKERAQMALDTAPKAGLEAADVDALRAAANEGGAASDTLLKLGLIDASGDATDQGRRALTALERGNVATYRAAVQDAAGRLGREAAKGERDKEKAAAAEERTLQDKEQASAQDEKASQDAARETAKASRRERLQNISLRRLDAGGKLSDTARVDLEDAGLIDQDGELTDEGKKRIAKKPIEPVKDRGMKMDDLSIKQTAEDRAMFANMGSSGGGGGKGGGKPTGGQGGLWKQGPDGKRTPQAGVQTPKVDNSELFGPTYRARQADVQARARQRDTQRAATEQQRETFFRGQTPTTSTPQAARVSAPKPISAAVTTSAAAGHAVPERYQALDTASARYKAPQAGWNQPISPAQTGYLKSLTDKARANTKEGGQTRAIADELSARMPKLTKWEASQFIDAMKQPKPFGTLMDKARAALEGGGESPGQALFALPKFRATLINTILHDQAIAEGLPF